LFPVFHQGTYIGAVEFGINNDYITDKIHRFAGYESFFFIDKHLLGTFSRIYAPIQIGESIGIDIPLQYQMFFNEYAQKHGQVENAVFTYSHKSYELNVLQVKNYASKPIGKIVFLRESNDFQAHVRHAVIASAIIMLSLIVLTLLIVDRVYRYLLLKMSFQERYSQMILDSVPSPVIVTDGANPIAADSSFLNYFNYTNI
jgi:hypothetical protein